MNCRVNHFGRPTIQGGGRRGGVGIEEGINGPKKHKEEGKTERTGGKREI